MSPNNKLRSAVMLACLAANVSQATLFTLTDGDSSVKVDDVLGRAYDWTIGGVNHLNNQWFYYRLGNTDESPIQSIGAASSVLNGTLLTTTYVNSLISVQVKFTLTDSATPGTGGFNEEITINNLSGATMNLNFFQYSDYNLGGDAQDQNVVMSKVGPRFGKAVQTDGAWTLTEIVNPNPTSGTTVYAEAALFNQTLNKFTDGLTTTLNNNTNSMLGDLTYAFQWNKTIAAGGSFQLSKLQEITVIPEPTAAAFLLLGGLATIGFTFSRRRSN